MKTKPAPIPISEKKHSPTTGAIRSEYGNKHPSINPNAEKTRATMVSVPHQLSTVIAVSGIPKNHTLNIVKKNG